jgi:hypothetical protein
MVGGLSRCGVKDLIGGGAADLAVVALIYPDSDVDNVAI